jgi:SAM-dependent methyltransferase
MTEQAREQEFDPAAYWETRLSERYTLGATGWSGLGEAFNRWSYATRSRVFRRVVSKVLGEVQGLEIMDVGSGTGFYLAEWQRLGATDLSGSDLTMAAVERLSTRFPAATIRQVDIGAEPDLSLAGKYDVVSIIDVLYHIVDDERYRRAMGSLAAMLKSGGTLIFSENFVRRRQTGRHQVSRTVEDVDELLRSAGLAPVGRWPMFFLMNTPVCSDSKLLHGWWGLVMKIAPRHEVLGWLLGALLFPIDVALARLCRTGPSTQLAVWRKTA